MKVVISIIFIGSLYGQGVLTQVNCPNPFTANQIILVQSVHVNPFINAPAVVVGCYQMDSSFVINNATTPPTISLSAGIISGGVVVNFSDEEVPSGTINSSNVTFTLGHTPTAGTLKLFRNGLRMKLGLDYTLSTNTITFLFAPQLIDGTADILVCDYRYQ